MTRGVHTDYYGVLFFQARFMRLLPREEHFYHLFVKQVEIISEASRLLLALRSDEPHRREEGADAARITSEQGQMGDVGVRADEER